jgi:GMP synthase-like glutamine amidotransferase
MAWLIQSVQQMHRDHVCSLPPGFHILLESQLYKNHSMVRYYPGTKKVQIITIQGHPEFTPAIVSDVIDAREASGVLNEAQVAEARRRVQGGEGKRLGRVIWNIIMT